MHFRDITYEDGNGNKVTERFWFGLNQDEMMAMQVSQEGGLGESMAKAVKDQNLKVLYTTFKDLILNSYGIKSEDGKRFIKNQQLRDEFSQSFAYAKLFEELTDNPTATGDFVKGILPHSMREQLEKAEIQAPAPPG